MKTTSKRILSLILSVVLLSSVFAQLDLTVFAAQESAPEATLDESQILSSGKLEDNLSWQLDENGVLTITGSGPMPDYYVDEYPWVNYSGKIKSVVIGAGVTGIGSEAFAYYNALESAYLSDDVTYIGSEAFAFTPLSNIDLGEGLKEIKTGAFMGCVMDLFIPASLEKIGDYAFSEGCINFTVHKDNAHYSNDDSGVLFDKSKQVLILASNVKGEYTIPDGVQTISRYAFSSSPVHTLYIPTSLSNVTNSAFADAYFLTDVYYSGTSDEWKKINIQSGNSDLTNAHIHFSDSRLTGLSVKSMPEKTVYKFGEELDTTGLTLTATYDGLYSETVSDGFEVSQIVYTVPGTYTIKVYYDGLTTAFDVELSGRFGICGDDVSWVLDDVGTMTIYGSGAMFDYERSATVPWSDFRSDIHKINMSEGILSVGSNAFNLCENVASVSLPESLVKIGDDAFEYCITLQSIIIPDGVTHIGNSAFACCDELRSVHLGSGVTTIDKYAFNTCVNLSKINLHDGITYIGRYAFSECYLLTSIRIPAFITTIEDGTFMGCESVNTVTIPGAIREIGKSAFSCDFSLSDVYYIGTEEQWKEVAIQADNDPLLNANMHFLKSIRVATMPAKTTYYLGEPLDLSGLTLTGYFDDTLSEIATGDYTVSGFDSTTVGTKELVIDCGGLTTTITVTVEKSSIAEISIASLPNKTDYWTNEGPDMTGLALNVIHSGGYAQLVTDGFQIYGFDSAKPGTKRITVMYEGFTAGFDITVTSPTINALSVVTLPSKTSYWIDEPFDSTGLTLQADYTDSSTIELSEGFQVTGFDSSTPGTKVLTVSFEGSSTTFDIIVETPYVTELTITSLPYKTTYWIGDVLDTTGLVICAHYSNGTTVNIMDLSTESNFNSSTAGTYTVTASYGGKNAHFSVKVIDPVGKLGDNITWVLEPNGTLTISGIGDMPYIGEGYPWLEHKEFILKVVISSGITRISPDSFICCNHIAEVELPDGLITIGSKSFYECISLLAIEIPESVTSIESNAFGCCTSLRTVKLPTNLRHLKDRTFHNCQSLTNINLPDTLETIGDYCFSNCSSLNIELSSNLHSLGAYAFEFCESLKRVSIPETVIKIEACAFRYCTSLTEITLPTYLESIGKEAFSYCYRLSVITIPEGVTIINSSVFERCYDLSVVYLPNSIQSIDQDAFRDCDQLTNISIPMGVTSIGAYAFYSCDQLEEISLPDTLISIGSWGFSECKSLKKIILPDSVTTIGMYAFRECISLESVVIGNSLTVIPSGCFYNCTSLKEVEFGCSLEEIGTSAFLFCQALTEVVLPDGIKTIESNAFRRTYIYHVILPKSLESIDITSFDFDLFNYRACISLYKGSYAHQFAQENDIPHLFIRDAEDSPPRIGADWVGRVIYTDGSTIMNANVKIFYEDGTLKGEIIYMDGMYECSFAEEGNYILTATDPEGNSAVEYVSVKRINEKEAVLIGNTNLVLKQSWNISGCVKPESSALVTLMDQSGNIIASQQTDNGLFKFSAQNGSYTLKAETASGSETYPIFVYNDHVEDIVIRIPQNVGTVFGYVKVQNRNGIHSPATSANVAIYNSEGIAVGKARSNANGYIEFRNLPLGEYTIVAQQFEMREEHSGKGYTRNYALTGYAYINVTAATTYKIGDIILYEENDKKSTFSGKITANGEPQECEVILRNVFRHEVARFETKNNGKYTFKNIPDGLYMIYAVTASDGMGFSVITVRNGNVYGQTDIKIHKHDKIKTREAAFLDETANCKSPSDAQRYKSRIADEKHFYDGLSDKERKQLSKAYVQRLNQLVEWATSCEYVSAEGVSVAAGGLTISGMELESTESITFYIDVATREEWVIEGGINSEEDYVQQEIEDVAGDRKIVAYYDVTMTKSVDGETHEIKNVYNESYATGKFRITLDIPEEYRGHKRYSFVHVHNGKVVELVDMDNDPHTITFEVSCFSTFALICTDEENTEEQPDVTNTITTQPENKEANPGDIATFSVIASGAVSYKWLYSKDNGVTWYNTGMPGFNTPTLSVTVTEHRNGYQYKCFVKFLDGTFAESESAILSIEVKCSITGQPESLEIADGETARFHVSVAGDVDSYQWFYRRNSSDDWHLTSFHGNKTNTLSVTMNKNRNGYQYYCVIIDTLGNKLTTEVATLTLKAEAVIITTQPADQATAVGETAEFAVAVSGDVASYQWFYRRNAADSWHTTKLTGYNSNKLSVAMNTNRNGYQYYCVITDTLGNKLTTDVVTLTLKFVASITMHPANQAISLGETAEFTVIVSGDVASYQWFYRRNAADGWHATKLTGYNSNKLSVAMNANRNGYQYYCVITDTLGNKLTTEVAALTLKAAVTITAQPADQSVAVDATATFAVTAEGEGLTYQWYYRRGAADSWHTTKLEGYNTEKLTVAAYATRDGYQYYCVITDAQGITVSSDVATLTVG